jgi:ABC-type nitrate/sulfonate/bicarbonate transport system substrate-binding protein
MKEHLLAHFQSLRRGVLIKTAILFLPIVLILGASSDGRTESGKLRTAYAAIAGSQVPIWMLKESRTLEQQGIDMELVYVQGASTVTAGLLSSEIQIAVLGTTAIVRAYGRGAKDLVLIGGVVNNPTFSVMVHPSISKPEDLRGKQVAITRFGGSVDFLTRWFLRRAKLEPMKDVPLVQVGDVPSTISALEKGSAFATVIEPPGPTILKKLGFKTLVDLPDTGIDYQFLSLATTRTFVRQNKSLVASFMKAYLQSVAVFKQDRPKGLQVLQKYLKLKDAEALQDVYETYRKYVPGNGALNTEGIRTIINEELSTEERKGIRAEDLIDASYIRR